MAFAAVQRNGKGTNAASISIGAGDGWATPTSGNLLVVTANSDATVTITGTWTAGPSVIDGNGTYIWYRISDGTESTITCSPSVSDKICITACEYSGNAASPFDVSNSSTISGSLGTTTTSVSVTTTADADLVIATAMLHGYGNVPVSPSWTNSFVNALSTDTGGATGTDTCTFYAELLPAGTAGSYSASCSWTNSASNRQELVIAFKAATTTADAGGFIESGFHPGRGPTNARFYQTPKSLDVVSAVTVNGDATLVGAGTVTDVPVIQGATAAPAGSGALTANVTQGATATPTGAGALVSPVVQQATAALTGAATLTADGTTSGGGSATLTGAGSLTATATQLAGTSPIGAGTVTAPATQGSGATATGAGVVSATVVQRAGTTLTGAGSLTATATQRATAAPAGAGAVTAAAIQNGKATPTGAGVLTAGGVIAGSADLSSVGAVTGVVRQLATVALAGVGVLIAAAGHTVDGTATLVGAGGLTAEGHPCVTTRPTIGTTVRPNTGITARPDTGTTEDPC